MLNRRLINLGSRRHQELANVSRYNAHSRSYVGELDDQAVGETQ
jgi:hypothetical protein